MTEIEMHQIQLTVHLLHCWQPCLWHLFNLSFVSYMPPLLGLVCRNDRIEWIPLWHLNPVHFPSDCWDNPLSENNLSHCDQLSHSENILQQWDSPSLHAHISDMHGIVSPSPPPNSLIHCNGLPEGRHS